MEVKYDVQQKELVITHQQAEIKQHRTRQFIYIGGLIASGLLLSLLAHVVMLRTHRNRALAEMKTINGLQFKPKVTAFARFAFYLKVAAVFFKKFPADNHAQPGSLFADIAGKRLGTV